MLSGDVLNIMPNWMFKYFKCLIVVLFCTHIL